MSDIHDSRRVPVNSSPATAHITPTPRTDAAWRATFDASEFSAGNAARVMRDECVKLEKELRQLRADVQFVIDHAGRTVATEVGELQCGPLWMAEQLGFALDAK